VLSKAFLLTVVEDPVIDFVAFPQEQGLAHLGGHPILISVDGNRWSIFQQINHSSWHRTSKIILELFGLDCMLT
jgi:hypothetical protein